jgi:uncharacterized protein YukE
MTRIHMKTEHVRETARQMNLTASRMFSEVSQLQSAIRRLDMAWDGGRSGQYIGQFRQIAGRMESQALQLETISARVSREVDEWEAADRNGSAFIGKTKDKTWLTGPLQWAESLAGILTESSKVALILGFAKGSSYPGQLLVRGSHSIKDWAGVSKNLTHIKVTNLPKHMFKQKISGLDIALGVLDFTDKQIQNWANYDKNSERAAAFGIDALFVTAKAVGSHYAGYAAATAATALLATVGAPVVAVAAVGVVAWWGGSTLFGSLADAGYATIKDDAVKQISPGIDKAGQALQQAAKDTARAVDDAFQGVVKGISKIKLW